MKIQRMVQTLAWVFFLILIGAPVLTAFVSPQFALSKSRNPPSPAGMVVKFHEKNQVKLAITNTGQIGYDFLSGRAAGFWPGNTPNNYVYGTGIWIGGIADIDGDGEDDQLFLTGFSPISRGSEFDEGRYGQSPDDPFASVFSSTDPEDLGHWPGEFKAIDTDPDSPTFDRSIPLILSDQDLVTIYNSVDAMPEFATPNPPIEIR